MRDPIAATTMRILKQLLPRSVEIRIKLGWRTAVSYREKLVSRDVSCNHLHVLDRMSREGLIRTAKVECVPLSLVRVHTYIEAYHRYYRQGSIRHYPRRQAGRLAPRSKQWPAALRNV